MWGFLFSCIVSADALATPSVLHLSLRQQTWAGFVENGANGANGPLWEMPSLDLAIGTPAQPVTLMIDTGSSALASYLTQCESPVCKQTKAPRFDFSRSSTFRNTSITNLTYGGGDILAQMGTDVITLSAKDRTIIQTITLGGGLKVTPSKGIPNDFWTSLLPSGLLGALCEREDTSARLIPSLKQAGVIPAGLLGLLYARELGGLGYASLGGLDKSLYVPGIVWDDQGYAMINATLDGKLAPIPCLHAHNCEVTSDTGAGLFSADIGMKWSIGSDCTGIEQLPTIGITLNGLAVRMTPQDYVFRNGTECISGLVQLSTVNGGGFTATPNPDATGGWQLSGRFFSRVYLIVDSDNDRFGYAIAKK